MQNEVLSIRSDMISENMLEDGLNANSDTDTIHSTTNIIHTINDSDIKHDNADRCEGDDNDKPDYMNIDCDRNLNIRCVSTDFEVINSVFAFLFGVTIL